MRIGELPQKLFIFGFYIKNPISHVRNYKLDFHVRNYKLYFLYVNFSQKKYLSQKLCHVPDYINQFNSIKWPELIIIL